MYFWFTKHFYCHSQHERERWGLGGHLGSRPQATTVGSATLPGDIISLSFSFLICPVKSATPFLLFVARGSVSGQPVANPLLALLPPLQPPLPAPSKAPPLHCTRPWAFARQGVESDLSPPTCSWSGWARAARDSCPNSPPGWGWVRKRGGKKEGRKRGGEPPREGSNFASEGFCALKCQARAVSSANEETGLQQ